MTTFITIFAKDKDGNLGVLHMQTPERWVEFVPGAYPQPTDSPPLVDFVPRGVQSVYLGDGQRYLLAWPAERELVDKGWAP